MLVFTNDGSWKCPTDVKTALIEIWGGGGGGAGGYVKVASGLTSFTEFIGLGTGGGAGGYGRAVFDVTPGAIYSINVGQGGLGGLPNQNGGSGGASSVESEGVRLVESLGGGGGKSIPASRTVGVYTPIGLPGTSTAAFSVKSYSRIYYHGGDAAGGGGSGGQFLTEPSAGNAPAGGGSPGGYTGEATYDSTSGTYSTSSISPFRGGDGAPGVVILSYISAL